MAYNEQFAQRIRASFEIQPQAVRSNITEKKMFGGIAFLYHGKMTVGIIKDNLMVRVISNKMEGVLSSEHVRLMDFAKRPMKEFVYVSHEGIATEEQLLNYIELGLEHAKQKLNEL
ncbi:TfoX/Sxy family protein [Arenibacter echinorum]|uniref:TfoX/Sxy family transcriptional regulator of competence genes n=1 Tax=Arenibacter echinorum TaxID=440515 RepID=A0A327R1T3_9FLAO|nr:TfoX/Sxy family protein [Arenibacter echinorum]RAJ09998.1 TfoX/Sxy family transcriptional regulator of competence genes [Arenibacter echinorum]